MRSEPLFETKLTAPSLLTDVTIVGDDPLWWWLPLALCTDDGGGRSCEAVGAFVNILRRLAHVRLYTTMIQQLRWTMISVGAIWIIKFQRRKNKMDVTLFFFIIINIIHIFFYSGHRECNYSGHFWDMKNRVHPQVNIKFSYATIICPPPPSFSFLISRIVCYYYLFKKTWCIIYCAAGVCY